MLDYGFNAGNLHESNRSLLREAGKDQDFENYVTILAHSKSHLPTPDTIADCLKHYQAPMKDWT